MPPSPAAMLRWTYRSSKFTSTPSSRLNRLQSQFALAPRRPSPTPWLTAHGSQRLPSAFLRPRNRVRRFFQPSRRSSPSTAASAGQPFQRQYRFFYLLSFESQLSKHLVYVQTVAPPHSVRLKKLIRISTQILHICAIHDLHRSLRLISVDFQGLEDRGRASSPIVLTEWRPISRRCRANSR